MPTPLRLKTGNSSKKAYASPHTWNVLVVDDEEEVHAVTRMILADIHFRGRSMQLAHAYSASEAMQKLEVCNNYAMILLDVVMESEHAGLQLARWIRKTLKNTAIRIVLRTGQPGQAPEATVIMEYDINDYKTKTELTAQKLTTTVITALRSYYDIVSLQRTEEGMQQILNSADSLFRSRSMKEFASGVLTQLSAFLDCDPNGILCVRSDSHNYDNNNNDNNIKACNLSVLASAGEYHSCMNCNLGIHELGEYCKHLKDVELIKQCINEGHHVIGEKQVLYLDGQEQHAAVLINSRLKPANADLQLLQLFADKISLGLQNVYLYEMQEQRIQKRTQQLAKTRDDLQAVLDHMPDVYIRVSSTMKVIWASKAIDSIFGYGEKDICDVDLQSLFVDANSLTELQSLLEKDSVIYNFKVQMLRKDESVCWISGSWRFMTDKHNNKTFEGLLRDITRDVAADEQRKKMDARIADMQRLESLGVLAGGIAHDFNNIMAAMVGNAELLRMDAEDNQPFNDKLAVNIISSGERATALCRQMLAYSGQGKYCVEALDITALISENSEILNLAIGSERILQMNLAVNLPTFDADAMQIKQVIIAILTNASEAMQCNDDNKILLSTGILAVNGQHFSYDYLATDTKRLVFIAVEDFGMGMDASVLAHVFDPFFSTKFIGRGLGLSAVMGIVRNHNGAIIISSTFGVGTRIVVYFPEEESNA